MGQKTLIATSFAIKGPKRWATYCFDVFSAEVWAWWLWRLHLNELVLVHEESRTVRCSGGYVTGSCYSEANSSRFQFTILPHWLDALEGEER
jgi:hypothetical protein